MEKSFFDMINNSSTASFLRANPFSQLGNDDINGSITRKLFFGKFLALNLAAYEKIIEILGVALSNNKNTIFITGYRGCGKTTFANCLIEILSDKYELVQLRTLIGEMNYDIDLKEQLLTIIKNIKLYVQNDDGLEIDYNNCNVDSLIENFDYYVSLVNERLKGKAISLNFETGTNDSTRPFVQKLCNNLRSLILKIVSSNGNEIFKKVLKIYKTIPEKFRDFENFKERNLNGFFALLESQLIDCADFNEIDDSLRTIISNLNVMQLLCLISLIDIAKSDYENDDRRLFYFFDNLDIVFETKFLDDFIVDYNAFATNMGGLMNAISELELLNRRCHFYDSFCFTFLLRETTAMLIADHFTDRLKLFSTSFDVSATFDKSQIIYKKFVFLTENKLRIKNRSLLSGVEAVYKLCSDRHLMEVIFVIFNNDYTRAIECLCEICQLNPLYIEEYSKLMDSKKSFSRYGARGIIYRLIYTHFKRQGYFESMGVNNYTLKEHGFSPSRLILTYLNSKQPKHISSHFEREKDSISIKTLVKDFKNIFSDNDEISERILIDTLWELYRMRQATSWSHLVTFDSIKSVSRDTIDTILREGDTNVSGEGDVRITCAGRGYVIFICSHFEFYACRFYEEELPLFMSMNHKYNERNNEYNFESIIKKAYERIEHCCKILDKNEYRIFIENRKYTRNELLSSPFVFHTDNYSMLQAERTLHRHISYIDAYRLHLINDIFPETAQMINMRIIPWIEKFVILMSESDIYSDKSKQLFKVFSKCIEIITQYEPDSKEIAISTEGYESIKERYSLKEIEEL